MTEAPEKVPAIPGNDSRIRVWDPLIRIGHWALVLAFAIAYLTGEEGQEASGWHEWAGYAAGAIVAWRIVWGFVGPDNARFSNFITGPQTSLRYLLGLLRGHSRRYLGHSPAGGAMIIALLLFIAATVITGLLADKDTENAAAASGPVVISQAYARDEGSASTSRGREKSESFVGELHDVLANITLGLVVFHLLGVALASFVHRENLVEAMITGKKRPDLS